MVYDLADDESSRPSDAPAGAPLRTGVGFDRVNVLMQTRRFADAEKEIRRRLVDDPNSAIDHALLSFALSAQDKDKEATDAAKTAIGLDPEQPAGHHALAISLLSRDRYDESLAAIEEAIRLDPYDASYHGLRANAFFAKSKWQQSLEAADHGLSLDPDHDTCRNFRAMALRQLGRRAEADATLADQLRQTPDDAFTHANQGWSELHNGRYARAQEHFREALRLDANSEYAREGMLEALKARNPLYRGLLRWKLWMSRLSNGAQWAVLIGLYLLFRVSRELLRNYPDWWPLLVPVIALYLGFVLLTWLGDAFFDSLLRLNKFGRLTLTPDRRRASNLLIGVFVLVAVSSVVVAVTGQWLWLVPVGLLALVTLPGAKIWATPRGWPRWTMAGYVAALGLLGVITGSLFALSGGTGGDDPSSLFALLFLVYVLGLIGAWILANILASVTPKR